MENQKKCFTHSECKVVINLVCDACKRYYCNDAWVDANDEFCHWKKGEDGLYHANMCDNCEYGCYCYKAGCEECDKEKAYFSKTK